MTLYPRVSVNAPNDMSSRERTSRMDSERRVFGALTAIVTSALGGVALVVSLDVSNPVRTLVASFVAGLVILVTVRELATFWFERRRPRVMLTYRRAEVARHAAIIASTKFDEAVAQHRDVKEEEVVEIADALRRAADEITEASASAA